MRGSRGLDGAAFLFFCFLGRGSRCTFLSFVEGHAVYVPMGGYCGFDVVQLHCSFQAKIHHSSSCVSAYQCSTTAITCQYPFSNTNILTFLASLLYLMLKNRYPPTYFRNIPLLWPNGQGKLSVAPSQVWYSTTFVRRPACILDPSNSGCIRYHVLLVAPVGGCNPRPRGETVKPSEALSGWPCCSARGASRTVASHQRYESWVIIHYFHTSYRESGIYLSV